MDITSYILGLQQGKSMGNNADVRYVTFMNGDVELYRKPVVVGDDCVNVVSKGLISTPTKESTAQYNYTFSGWSLTDGGTADTTNALANVTEDRTVYAAYTATVRTYTVRFYDGDTLLETKQVAYGTVPSIGTPTKDGYSFDGWEPTVTEVTSDQDYYAKWTEEIAFRDETWENISAYTKSGKAAEKYKIGDSKPITLTYADGTSDTVNMVIMDFTRKNQAGESTIILKNDILLSKKCSYNSKTAYESTVFSALPLEVQAVATEIEYDNQVWGKRYSMCRPPYATVGELGMRGNDSRLPVPYTFAYYEGKSRSANIMCTADGTATTWWTNEVYSTTTKDGGYLVTANGDVVGSTIPSNEYNICFLIAV